MDQAVVTTNREGIITSINRRGRELLGTDFDCVGRPLTSISTFDSGLATLSRGVLKSVMRKADSASVRWM